MKEINYDSNITKQESLSTDSEKNISAFNSKMSEKIFNTGGAGLCKNPTRTDTFVDSGKNISAFNSKIADSDESNIIGANTKTISDVNETLD